MSDGQKVYLVRGGRNGADEDLSLTQNLAMISFREVPSLDGVKDYDAIFKLVSEALAGRKPRALGNYAGQLWAFSLLMHVGDIVVMPRKLTSQIAIGQVTGPYQYREVNAENRHTRAVEWLLPEVPRSTFAQDLLYSFGAFMTVCNISRNDAVRRVQAILEGKPDPGLTVSLVSGAEPDSGDDQTETLPDLAQLAHDQIVAQIQTRFVGHDLTRLVDAVLRADGWVTTVSPPGPDGGVDILAGRGTLGLDAPRLCVQVKSQDSSADVTVYRTLQGAMQTFKVEQGLLVCWGGFTRAVLQESKQSHFVVRLWDSRDLLDVIYRNYEGLPAEIQAELPLKRVWMLVQDDASE